MRVDWKSMRKKYVRPPKGQFPIGSRVYIGRQGKGKTLSMVDYVHNVKSKYPDSKIFSNVILYDIEYKFLENDNDVAVALAYQNGDKGVIVLLDEAHLFFHNSNGIPIEVLTAISQQRKDRRKLVFTSQIWNELDMSLRKQVEEVVECRNIGRFQYNRIYDGSTIELDKSTYTYRMQKIDSELFKHNVEYYSRYDTYQKIIRNTEYNRPAAAAPLIAVQQVEKKKRGQK